MNFQQSFKIKDVFLKNLLHVWYRNFLFYKKHWEISLLWTVFEPLIVLFGIGLGLGAFVNQINNTPYIEFLFPALLCNTAMFIPYFESTYSYFSKLKYQKLYSSILLSPICPQELIFGEILWAASKGFFAVIGVSLAGVMWSLIDFQQFLLLSPLLFLTSWIFASAGVIATSLAKNYDWFIYTSSGLIIPLSLFSGTYFPMESYPLFFKVLMNLFPLAHSVSLARSLMANELNIWSSLSFIVLIAMGVFITRFAVQKFLIRLSY